MAYVLKNSFTRGEISAKALGRVDLELYQAAAETLSNWHVLPQGGLRRRSGSRHGGKSKTMTDKSRLLPFVYTAADSYVVEFGTTYVRFWTMGGQVVSGSPATITGITQANPAVVTTSAAHGYSNGQQVFISGVAGMTEVNGKRYTIANVTATTFELSGVDSTSFTAYTSGGSVDIPVETTTPYALADLYRIQYVQSGAVLYLVHPDYAPRKLTRVSNTNWTIAEVAFFDGPYDDIHDADTTVTSSGGTLSVGSTRTLTFTATAGINGGSGFSAADVGRHVRVRGTTWAWCQISAFTSSTVVDVTVQRVGIGETDTTDAGSATATKSWRLGMFGTTPGYPGSIALFEGRMVYGRTSDRPLSVCISRPGLPDDFGPSNADSTVTDDHGFVRHILQGRADEILWLHETPGFLLVGTEAGIRSISSPNNSENFGPNNVRQRLEIQYGTDDTVPVNAGSNTLVSGRYGRSIRDVFFDFNVNSLVAPNVSLLSDHLLKNGIGEMHYAQEPDSVVWVDDGNGSIFGITYDKAEKIIGYHPHDVTGDVESLCVIPGTDHDMVWMQAKRTINGQTTRYIEFFEANFDEETGVQADAFFVDSGLTYSGAATNVITGLDHLEGEEVAILGDGAVLPPQTVTNGQITLANGRTVTKAQVGLQLTSTVLLTKPVERQRDGTTFLRPQRLVKAFVDVLNSLGLKVGSKHTATLEPIDHRRPSDLMGSAPNLKNGAFSRSVRDQHADGGQLKLEITDPLPSYVRSINLLIEPESLQ